MTRRAPRAGAGGRGARSRNGGAKRNGADTPANILVLDIGGSKVKMLATGESEPRRIRSGVDLTPGRMVKAVVAACKDWRYDAISIGYPGLAGAQGPRSEPGNLGPGWVGFNFAVAFDRPVRIINDAAMQALGSYEGGRMLFLGLGTGVGSALIAQNVIIPLELGELPAKNGQHPGRHARSPGPQAKSASGRGGRSSSRRSSDSPPPSPPTTWSSAAATHGS